MITQSSTRTFLFFLFYCFLGTKWGNTYTDHLFQNESMIFWQNSNRWRGLLVLRNGPCGTALVALPKRMSLGQIYAPSSGSCDSLPKGRWFSRLAISTKQVCSSNGVNKVSPIALLIAFLHDFTMDLEHPFWWGKEVLWTAMLFLCRHSTPLTCSYPNLRS